MNHPHPYVHRYQPSLRQAPSRERYAYFPVFPNHDTAPHDYLLLANVSGLSDRYVCSSMINFVFLRLLRSGASIHGSDRSASTLHVHIRITSDSRNVRSIRGIQHLAGTCTSARRSSARKSVDPTLQCSTTSKPLRLLSTSLRALSTSDPSTSSSRDST